MRDNKLTKMIDSSNYDTCPYCGDEMIVSFEEDKSYRPYSSTGGRSHPSIYFYCRCCKARSPMILLDSVHIDKRALKESMSDYIDGLDGDGDI